MNKPLLLATFASVLLLGFLHHIGAIFFLYWDVVWYDLLVHFIGGLSVGMLVILLTHSFKPKALTIVSLVLLIGLGWEAFEYIYGIANPTGGNYLTDTSSDVLADILGAVASIKILAWKKIYG